MGFFGGRRARILSNMNNPRDTGGDGLTLAPRPAILGMAANNGRFLPDNSGFPGLISGFGGGTYDMDGTQVTAPDRSMTSAPLMDAASPRSGILGQSAGGYAAPNVDGSPMTFAGVQPRNPQKGGFFRKNGPWLDVVGAIGDALTGNPVYLNTKLKRQEMDREDAKWKQQRAWQVEDRDWKASQPDYFMSGRDRIKLDPRTGQTQVVYNGPEDFDEYASALGYEPGSDEYESAVLDYVLRGHGPTALQYDKQLDDYRTANDQRYDDYRTGNRLKVRSSPTYRDRNPLPLRPRAAPRSAAPKKTAVNPKTGEVISLNSRGQWVDKSGNPVK